MFELGWIEIGVIGVIALVVLGPERLPKAARFAGLWVRKARAQWFAVKAEMDRELAAEELKASLQTERESIRAAVQQLDEEAKEVRGALDQAGGEPLGEPLGDALGEPLGDAARDRPVVPPAAAAAAATTRPLPP